MAVNENVLITVREDGSVVVKRNLEAVGTAGTTGAKGINALKIALGEMTTSIQRLTPAGTAMQQQINAITGVSGRMEQSVKSSAAAFSELLRARDKVEALRASLDPAYADLVKFNSGFDLLESSLASGAITNAQYSATLELLMQDYEGVAASARDAANAEKALADTKTQLRTQVDALRASYDPLFAASKRYEAAQETLNSALRVGIITQKEYEAQSELVAQSMLRVGAANEVAAGHVGRSTAAHANLFAQFNDIAVMLAAGQNPLQLALQQGTQISQVLNGLGGGPMNILKALGQGFLFMINPISLATIAIIGFGSYAFQWLSKLWPEAKTVKDRMDDLSAAVTKYTDLAKLATTPTSQLVEQFGRLAPGIKQNTEMLTDFARTDAIDKMKVSMSDLSDEFGGFSRTTLVASYNAQGAGGIMKEIDATMSDLRETFNLTSQQAVQLTLGLEQINNAGTPDDAVAASQNFANVLAVVFGNAQAVPPQLRQIALDAAEVARKGGEIAASEDLIAAARQRNYVMQMQGYASSRMQSNQALADANAMLQAEQNKLQIAQLTLQYGADSVQVRQAEQNIALASLQTEVDKLAVAQSVKDAIMNAARQTNAATNATYAWSSAMASVAAQISGILSALSALSGTVIANASRQVEIDALKAGKTVAEAHIAGVKAQIETESDMRLAAASNIFERGVEHMRRFAELRGVDQQAELTSLQAIAAERDRASSGGSAGGAGPTGPTDAGEQVRLQNQLLKAAIDERIGFVTKLDAVNALLAEGAQGYSRSDAFNTISQEVGADLFAGTQEALDAQVAAYQDMYDKIDLMRQSDLISEQTAAQAKAMVDQKYHELRLKGAEGFFGELAKLSSSSNRTIAAIGKAAAVTQATIDGVLAVQKALASQPPPWNYAMAAAIGVTTAANVAQILAQNTNFAVGGSFDVGGSGGTDSQLVSMRVSPGERVTVQTPDQVRKGANAATIGGGESAGGASVSTKVINVIDPALLGDYMSTPEGEDLVMNVIRRNGEQLNQVIRNG